MSDNRSCGCFLIPLLLAFGWICSHVGVRMHRFWPLFFGITFFTFALIFFLGMFRKPKQKEEDDEDIVVNIDITVTTVPDNDDKSEHEAVEEAEIVEEAHENLPADEHAAEGAKPDSTAHQPTEEARCNPLPHSTATATDNAGHNRYNRSYDSESHYER